MKSRILWTLAVLNVLLVGTLMWRLTEYTAHAQAARRPGEYMAVSGTLANNANGVVYVLDSNNNLLTGLSYDPAAKRLKALPALPLDRVFLGNAPKGR